jgi:hypothetical protein
VAEEVFEADISLPNRSLDMGDLRRTIGVAAVEREDLA